MSIIDDALKKTQRALEKKADNETPSVVFAPIPPQYNSQTQEKPKQHYFIHHKKTRLIIGISCIFLLLIFTLFYANHSGIEAQNTMTLNGTAIANKEKIAVINNQMHHIGDRVGQFIIKNIYDNSILVLNIKTKEEKILNTPH